MLERHETTRTVGQQADRRSAIRRKVTALSYIQVGESNSGFVLDISEGGLSFQPFAGIESARSALHAPIRFQLPHSWDWIESTGRTVWTSEERIAAGVQFVDLSDSARAHIREWILTQDPENDSNPGSSGSPREKSAPAAEAFADLPRALASLAPTLKALNEVSAGKPGFGGTPQSLIPSLLSGQATVQPAMGGPVQVVVKLPSRWMVPLLVSVLVVVSFALGVSVGHGSLDHWLGTAAPGTSPALNTTVGAGGSSGTTTPNAEAREPAAPNSSDVNVQSTPQSASVATSSPSPRDGGRSGHPEPTSSGARSLGQTMLQDTAQGPVSLFIQPVHSVSASATTAISSSRSIALPVGANGITEPPATFHFGALLNHSDPSYPPEAIDNRTEGTVELRAMIGRDGSVVEVQPQSGPEALIPPSVAAVRIWRYQPTYLNGHSVETSDTVRITFRLPH